ncbi:hypothetical protein [Acetivibrio clariflavus]|uniref:Uncharacterized protein n=1 Tax=Acetivibrio clariflavus (strain DSM 19732 / NBRC 101661 / EBR45) TaxID=720554 RepID=G8M251_ACECE|nr:hypothetical protein [Acetivibrio clariflavus]AEV68169.1 hypothetical protein Clocl_1524 [Acetivibrio clariflavus DSM 19732]
MKISISINELKNLCRLLLDKAEKIGFKEIEFDVDNYWFVSSDERKVFKENTPSLCVGSITDDIQNLRKVLDKTNPSTSVDFDRLANVLIAVGEKISCSDKVYL